MKFVLKLGVFLLSLVFLVLIISLFVKRDYKIERTINIHRDVEEVYDYLRYLENHREFGVWFQLDPDITVTLEGVDGEENAILNWKSSHEDVGVGSMEITRLEKNRTILQTLRFKEPFESEMHSKFILNDDDGATSVYWSIDGNTPWPFNFLLLFMDMDKEMGGDLEKSLSNLKSVIE